MPDLLMEMFVKVATPFAALTVVVPPNVHAPGFVPMVSATAPLKFGSRLPSLSTALTTGWVESGELAMPLPGCVLKINFVPTLQRVVRLGWKPTAALVSVPPHSHGMKSALPLRGSPVPGPDPEGPVESYNIP